MKAKWIVLLILVFLAFSAGSNAWASRDPLGGGTWINRDPVEQASQSMLTLRMPGSVRWQHPTTNLYSYVANDPINYVDPLGLWGFFFFGSGGVMTPLPGVSGGGEGVTLFGWDSTKGWYSEQILAGGGRAGTANDNLAYYRGNTIPKEPCDKSEGINFFEANFGPEAGFGGAHVGAGGFTTDSGNRGTYYHGAVDALGEDTAVGFGLDFGKW